jgi:hypothetical protein
MTSGAAGSGRAAEERFLAGPALKQALEERVITAPPWWRELLGGLILFAVYSAVAGLDWSGRDSAAQAHGRAIFGLERGLGLDLELPLNRWLAPHDMLRTAANYEYALTYIASALALLIWLYIKRPQTYRWARTSFVLLNLLALGCFAAYPVAPPRLLPALGFVDTVRTGHTWGSWGSPMVDHANQLAAMPSLHIGWALWVSLVLAAISGARWLQVFSALHVLVTWLVIMATANHFLLDAVGGALLVWLTLAVMSVLRDRPGRSGPERVPAADAFFLHVESPIAAQHVGGLVMLDESGAGYRQRLRDTVEEHLPQLPRFRQRLSMPSRWRRPRWVPDEDLDWDWHVAEFDLTPADGRPGGIAALHAFIAEQQSVPLPRDRPLWRWMVVRGWEPDRCAAVLVVHHVVSDGIGTVAQVMRMLRPGLAELPTAQGSRTGPVRTALAIALGVAQLATDGGARYKLPTGGTAARRFGTVDLPLSRVREVARRHGARVSDVLMSAVVGALRRVGTQDTEAASPRLRVAVPLMVREPGSSAEGNVTAAVMLDVPLGPLAEPERLADVAAHSRRLRTGTRALASRFVMRTVGELLPPPVHAWFARTVYGNRFFQAIVSNMPGPNQPMTMAGSLMAQVYPILPLAPRAPLVVGALGWDGTLFVGISVDPTLVGDADELGAAIRAVIDELGQAAPVARRAGRSVPTPAPG